jgi:hypothetical protein
MSLANPLWVAPRIHGELLQSTVAKYMGRCRRPPSQSWKTFLRNHAAGIAASERQPASRATVALSADRK